MTRPLGGNARISVQKRKDGSHLVWFKVYTLNIVACLSCVNHNYLHVHCRTSQQRDRQEYRTSHLEHLHLAMFVQVTSHAQREGRAQCRDAQQRQPERPIVRGQARSGIHALRAAGRAFQANERRLIEIAQVLSKLLVHHLHGGAVEAVRMTRRIETRTTCTSVGSARPAQRGGRTRTGRYTIGAGWRSIDALMVRR